MSENKIISKEEFNKIFDNLALAARVFKKKDPFMGWVIYETIGMVIQNDAAINRLFKEEDLEKVIVDDSIAPVANLTVNGQEWITIKKTMNLKDIVWMANSNAKHPESYSCVYGKGPKEKPEGMLFGDREVEVVPGMHFTCVITGNA